MAIENPDDEREEHPGDGKEEKPQGYSFPYVPGGYVGWWQFYIAQCDLLGRPKLKADGSAWPSARRWVCSSHNGKYEGKGHTPGQAWLKWLNAVTQRRNDRVIYAYDALKRTENRLMTVYQNGLVRVLHKNPQQAEPNENLTAPNKITR